MLVVLRPTQASAQAAVAEEGAREGAHPSLDQPEPLATDRPGNGNAATTVAPVRLQIETSGNYAFARGQADGAHLLSLPTVLRLGVVERLELRLGSGLLGLDVTPGGSTKVAAATDTFVGTKVQALANAGAVPNLAFMVDVYLPSGQRAFTNGVVVPEARAAASWALPAGFGLLLNAGLDVPDGAQGRHGRFLYVANLFYAVPGLDGLSVFVEGYGLIPRASEGEPVVQVDWGAALLLGLDWQLDFYLQHGLSDAAPDVQAAVGMSVRI